MVMENMAFRALAAITAGFFWLAIMRFLSSYDEQVIAQEKTELAIIQMQHKHEEWIIASRARLNEIDHRLQVVEKRVGDGCAHAVSDEA